MYKIGIDLGGTNIAIGIVDSENNIVKKGSVPTGSGREPDLIIRDMAELCKNLLAEAEILICQIEYIGVACPGSVDPQKGIFLYAPNLRMVDYPIAQKLKEYFPDKRILVENDANAAAMGEALVGTGKGVNTFVMVTLGTGVGAGIIIDGKIYGGSNYAAGELGHMVIEHNGRQCSCGRKGCWETYSSATGLINITKEYMMANKSSLMWKLVDNDLDKVSGKTAYIAAGKGDMTARAVCAEYTDYLACGLTNIVNILQPDVISIGGGISHQGAELLDPLVEMVDKMQYTTTAEKKTKLMLATLKNDAGIIGAANLA